MAARFFRRGRTKFWWVPTIAATTLVPTATEVNAGVNMTPSVNEPSGFNFSNSPIATPDFESTFTGNIPGEDVAAESTLKFYEPTGTNALRTTLAKGTAGYVVIFYQGLTGSTPAAGDKCEVWPVTCTGPNREYSAGNDPAFWNSKFAMSAAPNTDAVLT